jgi:hypothetical protein
MVNAPWIIQIYAVRSRAVQQLLVDRLSKIDGVTAEAAVSGNDILLVVESPAHPHSGWVARTIDWLDPTATRLQSRPAPRSASSTM